MKKLIAIFVCAYVGGVVAMTHSRADAPTTYDAVVVWAFEKGTKIGARVTKLDTQGQLAKVGFKENDVIITYNKKPVSENFDLVAEMDKAIEKGNCAPIQVKRAGKYQTLTCK